METEQTDLDEMQQDSSQGYRWCLNICYYAPLSKIIVFCIGIFSTAFYLYAQAYIEGLSACDEPTGTDFCYVCDADSSSSCCSYDDYREICWCRYTSGSYFCSTSNWTVPTILYIFAAILTLLGVICCGMTIYGRQCRTQYESQPLLENEN